MDNASFLLTGGCGLQGSHIVEKLLQKHPAATVGVMNRTPVPQFPGVQYLQGDVTSAGDVQRVFTACKPTVVFHCAGIMTVGRKPQPDVVVNAVNFDSTRHVLDEAVRTGVRAFVFTSSASVAHKQNGGLQELINADESYSLVEDADATMIYAKSKANAERIVAAADKPGGIRTTILRPALIYGERDNDFLPTMLTLLRAGRSKVQIGDNTNKISTIYAGNGADAHLLAAAKLLSTSPAGVAGEAFFVTNGSQQGFWDFNRAAWRAAGDTTQLCDVRALSPWVAGWAAWAMEWVAWFRNTKPALSSTMVFLATKSRTFDISKARERLGYEPEVEWEEGVRRGMRWVLENEKKE